MRRYAKLSSIDCELLKNIFSFFFNHCDKINIYFPDAADNASDEITTFKNNFLAATHIIENEEELASLEDALEEKDGFSMVIASLTPEVKELLLNMDLDLHLSLGLIQDDQVLLYLSEDSECVIEGDESSDMFNSPLFANFKAI